MTQLLPGELVTASVWVYLYARPKDPDPMPPSDHTLYRGKPCLLLAVTGDDALLLCGARLGWTKWKWLMGWERFPHFGGAG